MPGKIVGKVSIGFPTAEHTFEQEAPDGWDDLSEKEKDDYIAEILQEEIANHDNSYAEYVED